MTSKQTITKNTENANYTKHVNKTSSARKLVHAEFPHKQLSLLRCSILKQRAIKLKFWYHQIALASRKSQSLKHKNCGTLHAATNIKGKNHLHCIYYIIIILPTVLRCCWLGDRKGIRPVKTEWWVAGIVICLEKSADLHMAQLMPLPLTVSCFSKIQIGFTFLVPAHQGIPGKRAIKRLCVCVTT